MTHLANEKMFFETDNKRESFCGSEDCLKMIFYLKIVLVRAFSQDLRSVKWWKGICSIVETTTKHYFRQTLDDCIGQIESSRGGPGMTPSIVSNS